MTMTSSAGALTHFELPVTLSVAFWLSCLHVVLSPGHMKFACEYSCP